jgi:hypothetical protein
MAIKEVSHCEEHGNDMLAGSIASERINGKLKIPYR